MSPKRPAPAVIAPPGPHSSSKRSADSTPALERPNPRSTVIEPRDYQREALEAIDAAWARGVRRQLVALPTGTGKTVMFAQVIARRGGRSLVLVHRDELVRQAVDKLTLVAPDLQVGVVKAERDEFDAEVVVASVQTASRSHRLRRLWPDFTTVVVDEAHHAPTDSYKRVLQHLGSWFLNGPLTLGVTATPERGDKLALASVFDEVVYERSILEMIQAKYLADLKGVQVALDADFSKLDVRGGDFAEDQLGQVLSDADAPSVIAQAWLEHCRGRKGLVFTPTVAVAHAVAEAMCEAGIAAEALSGATPDDDRRGILERLEAGETEVVANCAVLTEGYDCPSIDAIVVARPTRSRPLYIQMIGRGTRRFPGKENCLVVDLVGSATRHDLVTLASLAGVHPDELRHRTVTEALTHRRGRKAPQGSWAAEMAARTVDLFAGRAFHWLASGDHHVLSVKDGYVVLQPEEDGTWQVVFDRQVGGREVVADGLSLELAQGVAEDLVRRIGMAALAHSTAGWRQRPATDAQLGYMRRLGLSVEDGITQGQAADAIAVAVYERRRRPRRAS